MKLINITEAKFSQPIYAYHATSKDNLRSIISNGLQPNFKDGKYSKNKRQSGYGSTEDSVLGYALTPLGGVYFTNSYKKAQHIANVISTTDGGVIIICKVQPKQLELDEDTLSGSIINERKLLTKLKWYVHTEFKGNFNNFNEKAQNAFALTYGKEILAGLDMLSRQQQTAAYPYVIKCVKELISFYTQLYTTEERASDAVKHAQQQLTTQLKKLMNHPTDIEIDTFKLNAPVTFSGGNKIVGIYLMDSRIGWGDLGGLDGAEYHKVDTPIKLLD